MSMFMGKGENPFDGMFDFDLDDVNDDTTEGVATGEEA